MEKEKREERKRKKRKRERQVQLGVTSQAGGAVFPLSAAASPDGKDQTCIFGIGPYQELYYTCSNTQDTLSPVVAGLTGSMLFLTVFNLPQ